MLATALSIHLLKTGEGLLHACISSKILNRKSKYTFDRCQNILLTDVKILFHFYSKFDCRKPLIWKG